MNLANANIFVTGGAGTLGHAIARHRQNKGWIGKMTIYSTDGHKHELMRREFPDLHFIQGDIGNHDTLNMAMVGHDIVIHAAAAKIIPISEHESIDTFYVNVMGSLSVCEACVRAGISHAIFISTDKACHACNAYGASKYMMEKVVQEYARSYPSPDFHLVRYGNVLESNSSVLDMWKKAKAEGQALNITDPEMTRFWLSPSQAVNYLFKSLEFPSGCIFVPRLPSLSLGKLVEYVVGEGAKLNPIPIRPGEKKHEMLVTEEEGFYALAMDGDTDPLFLLPFYLIAPTTSPKFEEPVSLDFKGYTSDIARELTKTELNDLLSDG